MTDRRETQATLDIGLHIDPVRPLVIVDVDEVLAMFMEGFERYLGRHGLEMRIDKFALFQNIYRPGEAEHLDIAQGRVHFDTFFETDVGEIDVAPGAVAAMDRLSRAATIVILTNAPDHCRPKRARWLIERGMPYALIVNTGLKGPPVAKLAASTAGPVAFIDDLLPNLDSVAASAPGVHTFQMVADTRLRPLAFSAPERHTRIDHWPDLTDAIAHRLNLEQA